MTNFDYYYNSTQNYYFSFRTLFSEEFKALSVGAKSLYALMIERANLSNKNGWLDSNKRVYIIYTISQIKEDFQCSEHTAMKFLKELNQFGLIERLRTKIGQPHIIYVKVPVIAENSERKPEETSTEKPEETSGTITQIVSCYDAVCFDTTDILNELDSSKRHNKKTHAPVSDEVKAKLLAEYPQFALHPENIPPKNEKSTDAPPIDVPAAKNAVSTCKNCNCYLQKMQPSNINFSNINSSINNQSYPSYLFYTEKKKNDVIDMDEINRIRDFIKTNIEYDFLLECKEIHKNDLDNIIEIITDVMTSQKSVIRIAGEDRPIAVVKSVYSKLDFLDMQYIFECLEKNTTKIANPIAYIRTVLYQAKQTKDLYYSNWVQYDMAHHCA